MTNARGPNIFALLRGRPKVASIGDGLFLAHFGVILRVAMERWSARKLVAMFLAVFVTVGMSLSAVQASGMSAQMAMASDMTGSAHDGCPGCPNGGGDDGMKAMVCGVVCAVPILAMLPEGASMPAAQKADSYPARDAFLHGRRAPPDPYPPRTTDIG
ncbi:hypothetical protein X566_00115 [Afipia sp. P52-10]|jgi:hypothetical protein|uniref:hypothetical protein n=1 Tax=Afipia sp. P52-10 TaxID=1429916 RepID=UPI0003DF14DC|nr:hypothetical protein [Afipia sp. P52-10]ETR79353.1 hypothetical protein X566_00115 [Afipia sp. P52-10]